MRDQLIQYVRLLFAGTPDSYDMQQEILQNTLDRYDDLIDQGKSPEAAYSLSISGIGDINEILAYGAGKRPLHHTEIFLRFVFRHHTGTLSKLRNNLLLCIYIATINCCHVAAISAHSAADLTNFSIVHSTLILYIRRCNTPA